jgi:integrase
MRRTGGRHGHGYARGEVAGLAWADIDLEHASLTVNWQLGVIDSQPTFKPRPKSRAGTRTMALDPATADALREHRKRQLEERISSWLARHCREAGLPKIRLHDYAEVKVISERLGHANVAITIDTYSHVLPAADEAMAHTLATAILGGS